LNIILYRLQTSRPLPWPSLWTESRRLGSANDRDCDRCTWWYRNR